MSGKSITFGRYQKVEAILEGDRAIKAKLGPKTEIVCRPPPSNEKAYFAKPVVYITEQLHASGVDAHTTSKTDVLKMALKLLQEGDGNFNLPETSPAAETDEAPTPPPQPKPKVEKPKAVAAPKPVAKKPASGLAKASPPAKKPEPAKETKATPKDDGPSVAGDGEGAVTKPLGKATTNGFPLAYGVSIVTLLMTVDQIMEAHDHLPGRKERQQKVADLIKECQALTVIPKVSSAKEVVAST